MALSSRDRSSSQRSGPDYLLTLAGLLAAVAIRWLIDPILGHQLPLVTLYGVVAFAVWLGGYRPAMMAVVLGYVACAYLFIEPRYRLAWANQSSDVVGLLAYLFNCLLIIAFGEAMRSATRRARDTEGASRLRAETLQITFSSIGDAVITTDESGRITFLNAAAERLTGWASHEACGEPLSTVFHLIHEDTRQPIDDLLEGVPERGGVVELASGSLLVSKNGCELPIEDSAAPIRDDHGRILGMILIFRDITERRKSEHAAREGEAIKTAILTTALDSIITIDHRGAIVEFNPAAEQMFGYRRDEVLGRQMAELIVPPALRERHYRGLARYLEAGEGRILNQRIEMPALRADGTEFPVELAIAAIRRDGRPLFTAYVRDITDRKRAEAAAQQKATELGLVATTTPLILSRCSRDLRYLFVNRAAANLFGLKPDEMIGKPIVDIMGERAVAIIKPHVDRVLAGESVEFEAEIPYRAAGRRWMHVNYAPERDESGEVAGWVATVVDITDRKRAEQALRESEQRFKTLTSHAPVGIFQTDIEGNCLFVNERWCEIAGMSPEEARGQGWIAALHPEDRERVAREWYEAAGTGREFAGEYRFRTPGGTVTWLSGSAVALGDDEDKVVGYIGTVTDITKRKLTEDALRASEKRYRAVVESQAEMLCRFRPDGEILFVNAAYARALGTTPEWLIGRSFWESVAESDRAAVRAMLEQLTPAAPVARVENRFRTVDGERWTLWTNRALEFDAHGRLLEAQSSGIDITERKQADQALRENEKRLAALVESAADAIITIDQRGTIESINPAAERMFGYSPVEVVGRNVNLLMPEPYRSEHAGYIRNYLQTGEAKIIGIGREVVGRRKDGTNFPMELAVSEFRAAGSCFFTGIVRDITERKEAEQQLKESDRRKDQFLATLAHELRNPLAPIANGLELLKHTEGDADTARQVRARMQRQLQHLVRLVDDLLDVSRITRDKLELRKERVELSSVVHQAVETCRPLVAASHHQLTIDLPPEPIFLDADSVRLTQLFANLLNNACKYTEPPGQILVTATQLVDQVQVSVKDTGIGIAAEMLPRIFDMFAQLDFSLERAQGGLGIGLTLAKRLVEMHGGSIEAKSEGHGRGSEFVVRLPILAGVFQPDVASSPATARSAAALRVLVVDDNRDSAQSLSMLLKVLGHETFEAYDGREALSAAEAMRPDLILLDIGLPKMNGYDVCRAIRQQPWGKAVVIVAVTGWGQTHDLQESSAAGFDRHLIKPVDASLLANVLESTTAKPVLQ